MSGLDSLAIEERDALIWTGMSVALLQRAESILKSTLQLAFRRDSLMTLESMASEEHALRRATLGRLMRELRVRIDIAPDFDDLLDSFLEHRNAFVHGLLLDPLYSFRTLDGRERLVRFLGVLTYEATIVIRIMFSAVHAFAGEHDFQLADVADTEIQDWLFPTEVLDTIVRRK
jgi:hypothetical protein